MSTINIHVFENAKRVMNDSFAVILEYFIEDAEMYFAEMSEFIEENDVEKIMSHTRSIRTYANQFGAEDVSDIANNIELLCLSAAKEETLDLEEVKNLCLQLNEAFEDFTLKANELTRKNI